MVPGVRELEPFDVEGTVAQVRALRDHDAGRQARLEREPLRPAAGGARRGARRARERGAVSDRGIRRLPDRGRPVRRHDPGPHRPRPWDAGAHRHARERLPAAGRSRGAAGRDVLPLRARLGRAGRSRAPRADAGPEPRSRSPRNRCWRGRGADRLDLRSEQSDRRRSAAGGMGRVPRPRCPRAASSSPTRRTPTTWNPSVVSAASATSMPGRAVVVLRSFSKFYGLAGLRLGYAVVDEPLPRT